MPGAGSANHLKDRATSSDRPGLEAYSHILLLTVLWGSTFAITAVALEIYSPIEIVSARLLLGSITLLLPALALGRIVRPDRSYLLKVAGLGLLGYALPFSGIAWAQKTVPSGVAAIFLSTMPLFILVLSRVILREVVTPRKWIGFCIGLLGLVLLIGPDSLRSIGSGLLLAQFALLASVGCVAVSSIFIRSLPPMPTAETTGLALLFGGLFLVPFGALDFLTKSANIVATDGSWQELAPLAAILCLGMVLSGFGQLVRISVIQRFGPVFYSLTGYLIPVWATFLGFVLLGETLTLWKVLSFFVIVCGLLLAQTRQQVAAPG